MRRRQMLVLPLLAAGLGAGCSVLGSDPQPRQWYRLGDPAAEAGAAALRSPRVLLVEAVSSSALHEATALVYSRRPGVFAHYSFANWDEAPARSLARLLERRLEARGGFVAVGLSTSGLRGDLLLRVSLDELLHDLSGEPDTGRVAVDAELLDWPRRTRIARRRFARSVPTASADAAGATRALGLALGEVLDELAPWVEQAAR